MIQPTTDFDAQQAIARVSETARSGESRAGGKGKHLKPEDQRKVVQGLVELLVRSTVPLADIAQGAQEVPARLYAPALGEAWTKMTSERSTDALQWIEGLPKADANSIRRSLLPIIAEHDPKSGRAMLPAKPKDLDSREERERFAKNWLGRDAGLLAHLLAGELVEYEVTRVLRLFLRLASEPAVSNQIRSEVVRITAQGLTEHQLAETKTGIEPILQGLNEVIRALPSSFAASVNDFVRNRAPQVASRLGLNDPPSLNASKETGSHESAASLDTPLAGSESQVGFVPEQSVLVAPKQPSHVATLSTPSHTPTESVRPTVEISGNAALTELNEPKELVSALQVRAREYRDSAVLLELAASKLEAAAAAVASSRAKVLAQDERLRTLEERFKSLSNDLLRTQDQLQATIEQLRNKDESIKELTQSARELSSRVAEANAGTSNLQTILDAEAAKHKQEMELLVQRMSGQTNQRLEEFRNDVARRVSQVLRGTPPLHSGNSVIDGKAILVRLWEIIEALKQKSIPIRLG